MKKWKSLPANEGKAKRICEELGIPDLVGEILVARGVDTPAKVKEFLSEEIPFADPFSYKDMKKAVERINDAVDEGQRVCIYGDYDCDGMTATVLLYDYLQSIGCNAWYYIPDRESEGYGLNKGAIDYIASQETDLIVTVDNGISAIN
ncbi:MAG TPA: DHH family phosphoesterase, partial [Oscillospiraceae bacterium]|nr:DHH family phosphoesterase [Oscillospiraceae bacterium]